MLELVIKPESEVFEAAANEYQDIWRKESNTILTTFEDVTSLNFQQKTIEVIIYEGPSFSGHGTKPMKLRASYSYEVKQGTLIHELGHRLIGPLHNRIANIDEHRHLNLFLYDVWAKLYGKEFAYKMINVESQRKGLYDYESAWKWFLNLNTEEKSAAQKQFLDLNQDR